MATDYARCLNDVICLDRQGPLDSLTEYVSDHKDLRQLLAQIILHRTTPKAGEVYPVDSVLGIPPGSFAEFSCAVLEKMVNAGKITSEERDYIQDRVSRACTAPPTDPVPSETTLLSAAYGVVSGAVEWLSGWGSSGTATSTATPPSQP